ncbi:HalOD1 output domain-containing protein [Natrarchaeobius oligotrophus]|uniref:Halobacterial output domain-containing protein n=1 Tax=Natrarchaeobius chitinivorans TaxID=1679083 RepID=A0A3N6NAN5_NATCH|nr:HalOD1 output domain-containing protein [Natrarchaeobius chitinivorans]RQG95702.1 hypothetical protein EA472_21290 [Natrarchaeobius chitinivorans]
MSSQDDASPSSDGTPPSQAIIEAIAAREGVDVTDVEPPEYDPLYAIVNPEALDALFRTPTGPPESGHVRFEYEGYDVTVSSGGRVDVSERSEADDSASAPIED